MSFRFNWRFVDVETLYENCKTTLTASIAQARRPAVLMEPLKVAAIEFGASPPELTLDSVQSVTLKRVHLVFELKYSGDASIQMKTVLQANPLVEVFDSDTWNSFVKPATIAATDGLPIPFGLELHTLELDTLVDVVYTPAGVAVSCRDVPVRNIQATSSLDGIPGVQPLITKMLKHTLSESFYEDIPEVIWKITSPEKQLPDPCDGARRWSQHLVRHTRFSELSSFFPTSVPTLKEFATLSLQCNVPESIISRVHIYNKAALIQKDRELLDAYDRRLHVADVPQLDAADFDAHMVSSTPSPALSSTPSTPDTQRTRPRRRKISLRKLSRGRESSPTQDKETLPRTPSNDTFPSPTLNDMDTAVEFTPEPITLSFSRPRVFSSPTIRNHRKVRTASLQPLQKPAL